MDEATEKAFVESWKNVNIDYDTQTLASKVDTLRYCLPQLSILKETNKDYSDSLSIENEVLQTQQTYIHLMDDKKFINNYADSIMSLNKGFKNESKKWKCNLKAEDLNCITSETGTGGNSKFEKEYAKLATLIRFPEPEKNKTCFQRPDSKDSSEVVMNFDILDDNSLFTVEKESASSFVEPNRNAVSNQGISRSVSQNSFFDLENQNQTVSKPNFHGNVVRMPLSIQQLQNPSKSANFTSREGRQIPRKGIDKQKKYPWEKLRNNEVEEVPKCSSFRTASHQLEIENMKKFGAGRGAMKDQYGNPKRSLGSRGIKSRFVPPVRKDEESEGINSSLGESTSNPFAELITDERLKNIDAKMVELIMNEIMDHGTPVAWDDIAGLELAKSTIQEIVVWPMLRPDIFTGLRGPPKGILLFGPPGTGKTMIGKCIASQSRSTFFSISASSLTSKWIGEGEKMVRAMFAVAKCHQPAVIFIDEIDSLLTQRSDTEHESSRRIKTEFLVQLDGATSGDDERILVVGATNRPQELDEAARRRLVKRLYIPLPDAVAREQIIKNLLTNQNHDLCEENIKNISQKAEGYSGADMANLCREAALGPIRSIKFTDIQHISVDEVRPISMADFIAALNSIRASVSNQDLNMYEEWNKKYGINAGCKT